MATDRYSAVPGACGWMVVDTLTGQPIEIGAQLQVDLSERNAATTARLLNNLALVSQARDSQARTDRLVEVLVNRPHPPAAAARRSAGAGPIKV